jgi:hypothetical protein
MGSYVLRRGKWKEGRFLCCTNSTKFGRRKFVGFFSGPSILAVDAQGIKTTTQLSHAAPIWTIFTEGKGGDDIM